MLQKIVEEALVGLREELAAIDGAISAMEYLRSLRTSKGRSYKPSEDNFSIVAPGFKPSIPKKYSKFSAATRKKMAAAQKKRWAQVKKSKVVQMRKKKVA